jgi:hypothetical protein
MYYGKGNNIGIRRKFGDKSQCICFGSSKLDFSEEVLRGWGDDCLRKLDAGEREQAVEEWARNKIHQDLREW